jgi:putative heme-binding domain-containing protein
VDASGQQMTQLGGGVLRVRPDGTETEVYTHGLRNIYDVAIDPYMNVFTRGNTNDGGGWNIRFIHHIQSAEYGYPMLFKHFTEEIAPALVDLDGGSGTGSYFLHDPRWPDGLNHVPVMADWGRSQLFIHRVTMDGASFTQAEEPFLGVTQITDVDMDASGRMYLAAWDNAGYSGSAERGFVSRATPSDWKYEAYPASATVDMIELAKRLRSDSSVARLDASQELLTRPKVQAAALALEVATDSTAPLYVRVAGIFTYAQIEGAAAKDELAKLVQDGSVREFAIRALGDRKANQTGADTPLFWHALGDQSERVRAAATVALGRTFDNQVGMRMLLGVPVPASFVAPVGDVEGPHATPNSELLLAHLAVRSLVAQNATQEVIQTISAADWQAGEVPTLALWAARYLHDEQVVAALISALPMAKGAARTAVLESIARLFHMEADYDGSWWWNTRPDTHGPYYKTVTWSGTAAVEACLSTAWDVGGAAERAQLRTLNAKHRLGMEKLQADPTPEEVEQLAVDLAALANAKGEVGDAAIEDVMLALGKLTPDLDRGRALFSTQGCVACHTLTSDEKPKGPYMGQVGSIMGAEQIAESILRPNASISQGFASVVLTMKDGSVQSGFVSEEAAGEVVLRDIAGGVARIASEDVASRNELEMSMMPAGLASSLSFQDFVSLVGFLSAQK